MACGTSYLVIDSTELQSAYRYPRSACMTTL